MDTYEKKYKEALEKAEEIIKYYKERKRNEASIEDLQEIFPELADSEDEKIRKALIRFHKSTIDVDGIKGEDILAWLEKQGEKPSAIRWYDASLIPQEMEELLVEWESEDATWHEIAFYHADTKTFWDGTRQVENVTRWCYIIDLLEKQAAQKPFDYENANIQQKDFAPQVEQKPAWSEDDEEFLSEIISDIKFAQDKHPDSQMNQIIFEEEVTWLKSLKGRIGG